MLRVPSSPALRLAATRPGWPQPRGRWLLVVRVAGRGASPSHAAPVTTKSPGAGVRPSHAAPVTMKLTSSAFEEFGTIPKLYTCDGQEHKRATFV